ncbi:uncharacterized protein [Haliotis asinina]|uniref:uncharacterized protein n=1 Tax=Haliotis asinina TaxID=109174 RepID=UPI003531E0D8
MKQPLLTVCILSSLAPSVFCKSLPSCPPGLIKYETKDLNHICCVPIVAPNFCGQHFRVQRCIKDGEPDTCVKCKHGLVKFSNSTSESEEDRCYRQVCPEEAIPSLSKIGQCECDQSRCYYGDQYACTLFPSKCEENTYHKNGACVPCPEGTHRPGIGCGPCKAMSSLTSLVNNISVPNPNSATSPTNVPTEVPTKPPMSGSTIREKANVPNIDEAVDPRTLSQFPVWASILIALVTLILILLIIFVIGWFRKRNCEDLTRVPSNSSTAHDSTDSGGDHPPHLPPSYSQSEINQTNQTHGGQDHPCQINQNSGYCNGGTPDRCNNQTAKPFQNSRYGTNSEHPINDASQSHRADQPSSSSPSFYLSPTGFSSGSSGPLDRVSTSGETPDQTYLKVAAGVRETIGEQQRVLLKPPLGVVPADDDDDDDDDGDGPLLRPAPSLDPDSIQQDSQ